MPFYNAGMVLLPVGDFGSNWLSLATKTYGRPVPGRADRFLRRTMRFTDQITLPMAIEITEGIEVNSVPPVWNNSADFEMPFEDRIVYHYHRFRKIGRVGARDQFEQNLKAIDATYTSIDQLRKLAESIGVGFNEKALA